MVQLKKIQKNYYMGENSIPALTDVSLSIAKGEFVAVLGASGSGKSTLMNIVGCMDHFDAGEYYFNEDAIHCKENGELARLRNKNIGFIFQKYHLIPQYDVLQNVIMPLLIRKMKKSNAFDLAMSQIESVGLADRIHHRPWELSGGQQQRVAIARALVTKPELLLADEPTGALDSVTGKEILKMFQELHLKGKTILMITHDEMVAGYADRTIRLNDGRLTEDNQVSDS